MDFFEFGGGHPSGVSGVDTNDFAKAIQSRFGENSNKASMFNASMNMSLPLPTTPKSKGKGVSIHHKDFHGLPISQLPLHDTETTSTLLIDVRPPAQYNTARLPGALSLAVPSIFLKRPLCSLEKITSLISDPVAKNRFSKWREFTHVVIYDTDTHTLQEGNNILGLLRKFSGEGYAGQICWLQGGFQAVWKSGKRELVDTTPPSSSEQQLPMSDLTGLVVPRSPAMMMTHHKGAPSLSARRSNTPTSLPRVAASSSSTTQNQRRRQQQQEQQPQQQPSGLTLHPNQMVDQPPMNPFFDTIRQNLELSQGITEKIPLRLPRRVRTRIEDLPFEWLRSIARSAKETETAASDDDEFSSPELSSSAAPDRDEGMENLAMQFYRIELAEQRRMQGVMDYHSRESEAQPSDASAGHGHGHEELSGHLFPFSITAGVEKGAKNRYRHIWPFEHARVRLQSLQSQHPLPSVKQQPSEANNNLPFRSKSLRSPTAMRLPLLSARSHSSTATELRSPYSSGVGGREGEDDYVNASYVQPLCTKRKYIATQGPLEATFDDFWTLVWQQNVHVIVMLTREIEGSMIKCGCYWTDSVRYFGKKGQLKLELVSVDGQSDIAGAGEDGGYFSHGGEGPKGSPIVRRTFKLSYGELERKVVQLQYLEWPDMNVPDDARGVLRLVKELERVVSEAHFPEGDECDWEGDGFDEKTGIAKHALGRLHSPVLLHCSAGVGRTGGFIALDAVLDAIRTEVRKRRDVPQSRSVDKDGDVVMDAPPREESKKLRPGMFTAPSKTSPRFAMAIPPDKGGNVVHVPIAESLSSVTDISPPMDTTTHPPKEAQQTPIPMQVDVPILLPRDAGSEDFFGNVSRSKAENDKTTMRWAENVSAETTGTEEENEEGRWHRAPSLPPGQLSSVVSPYSSVEANYSPVPSAGSSSDEHTSGASSFGLNKGQGTNSSLGTSVSGTPPVGAFGTNPSGDGKQSSTPSLLPAFTFNSPRERTRTSSAPAGGRQRPAAGSLRISSPASGIGGMTLTSSPLALVSSPPKKEAAERSVSPFVTDSSESSNKRSKKSIRSTSVSASDSESPRGVDYKQPRPLHTDRSPEALSTYEEPLWMVLQDMREQRMSLCQSLRQYVFVHAAVIEGALQIVDEELGDQGKRRGKGKGKATVSSSAEPPFFGSSMMTTMPPRMRTMTKDNFASMMNTIQQSRSTPATHGKPPQLYLHAPSSSISSTTSVSSKGKRVASPTELTKEDKKGQVALSKRPSIKRKSGSDESNSEGTNKATTTGEMRLSVNKPPLAY